MTDTWFWQRAGMRAALAFGAATAGGLKAGKLTMDPMMSALVRFVRRLPAKAPAPQSGAGLGPMRTQYAAALGITGLRPTPGVSDRPWGSVAAGAREYRPARRHRGTLLYFHGGGFIMGSPATHDGLCRRLAAVSGLRVISAGYRLAPEHPYPAAHDDAQAALAAIRKEEAGRLIVGGDSAGANLAASLARDGEVDGQFLLYPVVDMVQSPGRYPSLETFSTGYLLTAAAMEQCATALIPPGVSRDEPRLSPIRADLTRAAPAVIVVAGFDPLADQGRAFASALRAAGRPAELIEEMGLVHGFADFAGVVPAARRAVDRLGAALGRMVPA
ncbi:MAG: alpha/beta hydrolase [Gemmatimonadaceae bacterium]|nr:alpha/beta hydrolase [Acetobacteraceae bacterium]